MELKKIESPKARRYYKISLIIGCTIILIIIFDGLVKSLDSYLFLLSFPLSLVFFIFIIMASITEKKYCDKKSKERKEQLLKEYPNNSSHV